MTAPALSAADEKYPSGPITMVVPYPAGGSSDTIARVLSGPIGEQLGVQVVVENVGGATGSIAANKVLNAKADGGYFFQGSANELILPPLTNSAIRFTPDQFQNLHPINTSNLVLLVKQDLPVRSIDDFVKLAKERASSTPLTYGTVGVGSLYHLVAERMAQTIKAPLIHAPYRGSAPAMQDLAGGQIDFTIQSFSKSMKDMEKDGRYKIIAIFSKDKPGVQQEYASISDHELFKDFEYTTGSRYYVKTGTPDHIVQKLNQAIANALQDPKVVATLEGDGRTVSKPTSVPEAKDLYLDEIKTYEKIIKETGFKHTN
ncbi:tripartite tricarboxylate transporter substrate binding protein [Alcaligenaceae bacterium]|nr:tripartite tricarboxylate transporter substrate binding protein [Alcaligenaceae bacterium]